MLALLLASVFFSAGQNQDVVLAVDMSLSLVASRGDEKASDPEGLHWDAIDFIINSSDSTDRIALLVFRTNPLLATRFITGGEGFVEIGKAYSVRGQTKTGREWLKVLVSELRDYEQWCGKNETDPQTNYLRTGLIDKNVVLAHGTANLLALRALNEIPLLSNLGGRACWAMLFTDGFEDPRFNPILKAPDSGLTPSEVVAEDDCLYVAALKTAIEMQAKDGHSLDDFVKPFVQIFKDKKIPLFTFGLGAQCNMAMMRSLSKNAGRDGDRVGGAYNPMTNVELFNIMRDVQWELRERWIKGTDVAIDQKSFQFPVAKPFRNVGFYVYQAVDNGIAQNIAPGKEPFLLRNRDGFLPGDRCESHISRSHWYYAFDVNDNQGVKAPDQIELRWNTNESPVHGYVGVQTDNLFAYSQPQPTVVFSPKDAIPFEMEFLGVGPEMLPENFKVVASVSKIGADTTNTEQKRLIQLVPKRVAGGDRTVFSGELILDPDPKSKGGKGNLKGEWSIDITLEGVESKNNPTFALAGYKRKLLRRNFIVGDYKGFKNLDDQKVVFSNTNPKNLQGQIIAKLDLLYPPSGVIAQADVSFEPDSANPEAAKVVRFPKAGVTFDRGVSVVSLNIEEEGFRNLKAGEFRAGKVSIKLPWGPVNSEEVFISKKQFEMKVDDRLLAFDMSAQGKTARKEFRATLVASLGTKEKIWLTKQLPKDLENPVVDKRNAGEIRLEFTSGGGEAMTLSVEGMESPKEISAENPSLLEVKVALPGDNKPKSGTYRGKVYLVGRNFKPVEMEIMALVDSPVFEIRQGKEWKPVNAVRLPCLAGGRVQVEFRMVSQLGRKVSIKADEIKAPFMKHPIVQVDTLSGQVDKTTENTGLIGFQVPPSVFEGVFTGNMNLGLEQEDIALKYPSIPVSLDVIQRGLLTEAKLPLSLQLGEGSVIREGELDIKTTIVDQAVGWRVEKPRAVGTYSVDPERIEVWAKEFRLDNQANQVSDPVTLKRPVRLKLKVNTAGMEAGLYKGTVHLVPNIVGYKENVGAALEIPFEFMVQGRSLALKMEGGDTTNATVEVTNYGTPEEPGVVLVGGKSFGWNSSNRINGKDGTRNNETGGVLYQYRVRLDGLLPGENQVVARVDGGDPRKPGKVEVGEKVLKSGSLRCEPRGCKVGDKVLVTLPLSGEMKTGYSISELRVEFKRAGDSMAGNITLRDNGQEGDLTAEDGIYSGGFDVKETGEYSFKLAPPAKWPKGLTVLGTDLACVFTLDDHHGDMGKMIYGGGMLASLFGVTSELESPRRVTVKNIHQANAKWRATILYPKNIVDSENMLSREADSLPVTPFDGAIHLDNELLVDPEDNITRDGEGPGAVLQGHLGTGQELHLGLLARLSKEAEGVVYGEPVKDKNGNLINEHPGLENANGVIIQLELDYEMEQGKGEDGAPTVKKFSRTIRIPVSYRTENWSRRGWMLGSIGGVVACGFGIYGTRWWVKQGKDGRRGGDKVMDWLGSRFKSGGPKSGPTMPKPSSAKISGLPKI